MAPRFHEFFAYARKRHEICLRRETGVPRPWTKDQILREYKFTNVFRELDKTTAWFRKYVREPLRDKPEVLLATAVFRMFNRIETGEAIFLQQDLLGGRRKTVAEGTAFDAFLEDGDVRWLKNAIVNYVGKRGPYVTGAYIISSPAGYSKLDGVLKIIKDFKPWRADAEAMIKGNMKKMFTLEGVHKWLREFSFLGNFHSYEIVTDLRHTALLDRAPDIETWANLGPGAKRGLNRIHGRRSSSGGVRGRWSAGIEAEDALREMREILEASRLSENWPQLFRTKNGYTHRNYEMYLNKKTPMMEQWPVWEMREVEHTLCEFDKYERVRTGEGKPRGVFR